MKTPSFVAALAAASLLAGCAITQTVKPVSVTGITEVCVKNNPQVMMSDYLKELRSQVEAKGIKTSVFDGERPGRCKHHLEYTANWRWDLAMYLVFADLRVYEEGLLIGQATYDAHGGGASFNKFGKTAEKLKPLVDELFAKK
jgi:hypothetical protein